MSQYKQRRDPNAVQRMDHLFEDSEGEMEYQYGDKRGSEAYSQYGEDEIPDIEPNGLQRLAEEAERNPKGKVAEYLKLAMQELLNGNDEDISESAPEFAALGLKNDDPSKPLTPEQIKAFNTALFKRI